MAKIMIKYGLFSLLFFCLAGLPVLAEEEPVISITGVKVDTSLFDGDQISEALDDYVAPLIGGHVKLEFENWSTMSRYSANMMCPTGCRMYFSFPPPNFSKSIRNTASFFRSLTFWIPMGRGFWMRWETKCSRPRQSMERSMPFPACTIKPPAMVLNIGSLSRRNMTLIWKTCRPSRI